MGKPRWCKVCQDYVTDIGSHIKQHGIGENSDARDRKQYNGRTSEKKEDYFICVLHQRKTPCPARKFDGSKCDYNPLGMIRKSFMMNCLKGLPINSAEHHLGRINPPYFPVSDDNNCWYGIKVDMDTRTVVIKGMTIKLRF